MCGSPLTIDVRPLVTSAVGLDVAFEALVDPERECKIIVRS